MRHHLSSLLDAIGMLTDPTTLGPSLSVDEFMMRLLGTAKISRALSWKNTVFFEAWHATLAVWSENGAVPLVNSVLDMLTNMASLVEIADERKSLWDNGVSAFVSSENLAAMVVRIRNEAFQGLETYKTYTGILDWSMEPWKGALQDWRLLEPPTDIVRGWGSMN